MSLRVNIICSSSFTKHFMVQCHIIYVHAFKQHSFQSWLISNLMHKILIYFYIIHLLKFSTYFEHYPALIQEVYVVIVYIQPLVPSLSAGDCPVHRLRKNFSFSTGAQDSHLQTATIPEAAYIQLRRRPPEDEQGHSLQVTVLCTG